MSNDSEERGRATEILRTRGVARRGLSMTPESHLNPERIRRGQEEARRAIEREITLSRLAPLRLPPPILTRYWAALLPTLAEMPLDEAAEIIASILPVTGEVIDFHYLIEGRDLHGRELSGFERALSGVSLGIELLIPLSGRLVRAGREALAAIRIATRTGREVGDVVQVLRELARLERNERVILEAIEAIRRGESLAARHQRALREFVDALEGSAERGTARRSTNRAGARTRELGSGSSTRSAHRGNRAERTPGSRGGRRAEGRPRGRASRPRRSGGRTARRVITTVLDVLRESGVQATRIADVRVGGSVEPIFRTSKDWIVGSYDALQKYKEMNTTFFRWEAHHIIEVRHFEVFPVLMSDWTRGNMPAVLLNKSVHGDIAGELSRALPIPLPKPVRQTQIENVFDGYEEVYGFVLNSEELLDIVETMLRL